MAGDPARWAIGVALGVARDLGVRCDAPDVLAGRANVVVWLRPAPVVARVPTMTAIMRHGALDALAREIAVARYLSEAGAPVVPPSTDPPAGPHVRDGVAVTLWPYRRVDPGRAPTPDRFGRMLRELHAAMAAYPGRLPYLGTPYTDIASLLSAGPAPIPWAAPGAPPPADAGPSARGLAGDGPAAGAHVPLRWGPVLPRLDGREREAAWRELARLREALGEGPGRPLHGDAHPGNLLATDDGWRWSDFEDTCAGPVEWDLACLLRTARLDGRAAVRAYGRDPDDPRLAPLLALRRLHGGLYAHLTATYRP